MHSNEAFRARVTEVIRDMRPTAVFATTVSLTRITLQTLDELGLRIPEDVSVIGFDGVGAIDGVGVKLYTIMQPTRDIGATAAQIMAMQIETMTKGQTPKPQVRTLSPRLVRGSSLRIL